ncbi:MAG TPA: AraC family transcriptional regulator [Clostridiales bacterium]|nr:AraC family transcriptional regulator [Clostridiales bacterium]
MFKYVYNDLDVAHKYDRVPKPSPEYAKHYHDFYEMFYFVKGKAFFTVEEEKQVMSFGDILLIQPGVHHFVTFFENAPYERYVLKFQDELVPDFLKNFFIKRSAFFTSVPNIQKLFRKLDSLYRDFNAMELEILFSNVITEILIRLNHTEFKQKAVESDDDESITKIIQYINENIRKNITIEELCDKFHFSQSHLYKEFQTYMRTPIMKYIRSKKIIAANQLIRRGEKPTKVAEQFGFMEYSTFYRSFIDVMGYPPSRTKSKNN